MQKSQEMGGLCRGVGCEETRESKREWFAPIGVNTFLLLELV